MPANIRHTAEVAVPIGLVVKKTGEYNGTSGGKLTFSADSTTSLAAAKAALDQLGTDIKAAAV